MELKLIPLFFVSLVLSWIFTFISIKTARSLHFYAHPDHRSSHKIPTPRIGGSGFVISFSIYMMITLYSMNIERSDIMICAISLAGGMISFIFGFVDDVKGLSPKIKFTAQIVSAVIPACLGIGLDSVLFPFELQITLPSVLNFAAYGLGIFWLLSFMNLFNFMDGMNGKAGTFSIFSLISIMVIIFKNSGPEIYLNMIVVLTAGLIAFLYFNLTPAKTFMGDCGSQFLGYILGIFALDLNKRSPGVFPFVSFFLIYMPFIYDAVYTIIRRIRRGEKLSEAHHSHLYQRLLELGYTHPQVLKINMITYFFCGLGGVLYSFPQSIFKILGIVSAFGSMIIYNLYVIKCEKESGKITKG